MKIEDRDKILTELYNKYKIESDVDFNEFNVREKLISYSSLLLKYKDNLIREKSYLEHLNDLKARLEGRLYDKFKFEGEKTLSKQEIEKYYLPKEEKVIKLKNLIDAQQIVVDFLDMAVKVVDKLNWNMKLFIEGEK
jgi:hypothetical protein